MVTAVEKASGGTTLQSVTFTYDALDNRIGMDENSTQTWTLYDGGNPITDFNSSGSLATRYLWGPTGIVARQTSGGTVSWYLADRLGTVRDLINNSGAIIDHVDFSAFGTVLDESSPTSGDRMMGLAGLERDPATGSNLAVYREENPGTGRWDSQDPLGFAAEDADLYRYVNNGPINHSDRSGLDKRSTWAAGWLTVDPGFTGPPGILYIPEDEHLGPQPLEPGTTKPADALLLPRIGLIKIPFRGKLRLISYDPKKNQYWFQITSGGGGNPIFYPIGTWNPFGDHGDVPGSKVHEGKLPKPPAWTYLRDSRHGSRLQGLYDGCSWISSVWDPSDPLNPGYRIYYSKR